MSKRTKKIIALIKQSGKKAADPQLDTPGFRALQQNTRNEINKTFKEFVEENVDLRPRGGETYSSERVQKGLQKHNTEKKQQKADAQNALNTAARNQFRGSGMISYEKHPTDPTKGVVKGVRKNGVFTPDNP